MPDREESKAPSPSDPVERAAACLRSFNSKAVAGFREEEVWTVAEAVLEASGLLSSPDKPEGQRDEDHALAVEAVADAAEKCARAAYLCPRTQIETLCNQATAALDMAVALLVPDAPAVNKEHARAKLRSSPDIGAGTGYQQGKSLADDDSRPGQRAVLLDEEETHLAELMVECDRRGLDFGVWSDRKKRTPDLRYEVRVFGTDDVRVRTKGVSLDYAAMLAVAKLRSSSPDREGGDRG